jgi:hypothetical protein
MNKDLEVSRPETARRVISITGPRPKITVQPQEGAKSTTADCGHVAYQMFDVFFNGVKMFGTTKPWFSDEVCGGQWAEPCFGCGERDKPHFTLITLCTFCGGPILPGKGVCLFETALTSEQEARAQRDERGNLMSCMSMDCTPSGGFFAGHWNGTGIDSPFEHGVGAVEALMTGKVVVSSG